jgi:hypothetical protein
MFVNAVLAKPDVVLFDEPQIILSNRNEQLKI